MIVLSRPTSRIWIIVGLILFLGIGVCSAQAQIGTARVEILTAFDLENTPVQISAKDHMLLLDGKSLSFPGPVELSFNESIHLKSGGAKLSGSRFQIKPNREKSIAIVSVVGKKARSYPGIIRFQNEEGKWVAVNELPGELYVAAVVDAESTAKDAKFLQMMSLMVRTRAIAGGPHRAGRFCDRTCCMIYQGAPGPEAIEATRATRGQELVYQGKPIPAFFHACCAGHTRPVVEGIALARPHPALSGVSDLDDQGKPWCASAPHFSWTRTIPSFKLEKVLMEYAKHRKLGELAFPITVSKETEKAPFIVYGNEDELTVDTTDFRMYLGRKLGWNILLSDRFAIVEQGDRYLFTGHGFGHRVGLCQAGALARLRAGQSIRQVLQAYFPGVDIRVLKQGS